MFGIETKSRSMNAPCTEGIRETKGCQLCKSGHKSIFYFCDKFSPPNWQSLELILSLSSRKFKYFIFMIEMKGKKTKENGTKINFVHKERFQAILKIVDNQQILPDV